MEINFTHIFEQLFKEDCKPYSCVRLERSSGETNYNVPRTLKKKKPAFFEKKKGKKEKEKREGKAVRTN